MTWSWPDFAWFVSAALIGSVMTALEIRRRQRRHTRAVLEQLARRVDIHHCHVIERHRKDPPA